MPGPQCAGARGVSRFVPVFLLVLSCGGPAPCPDGGRYPGEVAAATRSPDGTGWCCAPSALPGGSYCGGTGGWVADRCECAGLEHLCDAPHCAYRAGTDAHGFSVWFY